MTESLKGNETNSMESSQDPTKRYFISVVIWILSVQMLVCNLIKQYFIAHKIFSTFRSAAEGMSNGQRSAGDVLNDIGSMLSDLTDELDAMLHMERDPLKQ